MDIRVRAKEGFIHGPYNVDRGQEVVMDSAVADELAHLVEKVSDTKAALAPSNKMMPAPQNKGNVEAAGEAPQLSASPAAPVSLPPIAKSSALGGKTPKQGKTAK